MASSFVRWILFSGLIGHLNIFGRSNEHFGSVCNTSLYDFSLQLWDHGILTLQPTEPVSNITGPCQIKLKGCDACKIEIVFHDISLNPCQSNATTNKTSPFSKSQQISKDCEHLVVSEPYYPDSSLILYSGNSSNQSYVSLSSMVYIQFYLSPIYDSKTHGQIWLNVSEKLQTFKSSYFGNPNWGSLLSPNFPNGYAQRGEIYGYLLQNTDPGGLIHVTFSDWDLSLSSRIIFYTNEDKEETIGIFFGSSSRPVVISKGSTLFVEFHADVGISSLADNMGFQLVFHFANISAWSTMPSTECGLVWKYVPGGNLSFQGPSRNGSFYMDCIWVFTKHSAYDFLLLRFFNVHIFSDNNTTTYSISIHEGLISSSPLIANHSAFKTLTMKNHIDFIGGSGFYVRLKGLFSHTDRLDMMFVAFNPSNASSCNRAGEFHCDDGLCIDKLLVCDGIKHCRDKSDEDVACATFHPPPTPRYLGRLCKDHEFLCKNGKRCVAQSALCDAWLDCSDGSDEYHSMCQIIPTTQAMSASNKSSIKCQNTEMLCRSGDQCVSSHQVCDTFFHCLDKSDEIDCAFSDAPFQSVNWLWKSALPIGMALCGILFLCAVIICFRVHCRFPRWRYQLTKWCTDNCFIINHGTRSMASDTQLTLSLTPTSVDDGRFDFIPDSPPSYEEATAWSTGAEEEGMIL